MYKDIQGKNRPTRDEVYGFAGHVGAETRPNGSELVFKYCPFCKGQRRTGGKSDTNTFSINIDSGAYKCQRSSCGAEGSFVELAQHFNFPVEFDDSNRQPRFQQPRTPKKKKQDPVERLKAMSLEPPKMVAEQPKNLQAWSVENARYPSPEILEYFRKRGISEQVVAEYRIEAAEKPTVIKWNFFEPTGESVELIKFRDINFDPAASKRKEVCLSGGRRILYGMERCDPAKSPLIITEGQIDALSLAEAGIPNVVSVPIGKEANTWVGNCFDFVNQFKEIIVFGDREVDKDGVERITLVDHVENRFDLRIKVIRPEDYQGCKDANEILVKFGKDALWDAVINARLPIIDSSTDLADIEDVDLENLPHFETGIQELDKRIRGFYAGQLVLLTGKSGEGKSTFASQVLCEIVEQGGKCLVYSGELDGIQVKNWLFTQLAGSSPDRFKTEKDKWGIERYSIRPDVKKKLNDWIRGKVYVYRNNFADTSSTETERIINCCLDHIRKLGVKFILVDNLMTAVSSTPGDNIYDIQTSFVMKLKGIAQRYGVVIMLVAHPRKTKEALSLEDICGASNVSNLADVAIGFGRIEDEENPAVNCAIRVFKSRLVSDPLKGDIKLKYASVSKRITDAGDYNNPAPPKKYGWERPTPENPDGFTPVYATEKDLPF